MEKIICPICGVINAVKKNPWNENGFASQDICPCCGTHYGEDDWAETEKERAKLFIKLREKWIANGMKWWAEKDGEIDYRKPLNWSPVEQLKNLTENFDKSR